MSLAGLAQEHNRNGQWSCPSVSKVVLDKQFYVCNHENTFKSDTTSTQLRLNEVTILLKCCDGVGRVFWTLQLRQLQVTYGSSKRIKLHKHL